MADNEGNLAGSQDSDPGASSDSSPKEKTEKRINDLLGKIKTLEGQVQETGSNTQQWKNYAQQIWNAAQKDKQYLDQINEFPELCKVIKKTLEGQASLDTDEDQTMAIKDLQTKIGKLEQDKKKTESELSALQGANREAKAEREAKQLLKEMSDAGVEATEDLLVEVDKHAKDLGGVPLSVAFKNLYFSRPREGVPGAEVGLRGGGGKPAKTGKEKKPAIDRLFGIGSKIFHEEAVKQGVIKPTGAGKLPEAPWSIGGE